jgi:diacylglycerol kinase (ATP)
VREILDHMQSAKVAKLDRWRMEIVPAKHFRIRLPARRLIVNNYASIGVDALVTLNFHRHRQSRPMLFGSRIINKLWYFTYGTKDVLERECKDLQTKLQA